MVGTSNQSVPEMAFDQIHRKFLVSSVFCCPVLCAKTIQNVAVSHRFVKIPLKKDFSGRQGPTKNH